VPAERSVFMQRVLQVVSRIPPGRVATYGDVARLAGKPRAARAVGTIMRRATRRGLPYHRVVGAGGALGGYGGSVEIKVALLTAEGLIVRRRRLMDFSRIRWSAPASRAGGGRTSSR
jgi:O-6-methylguanine DNA methyltransferase